MPVRGFLSILVWLSAVLVASGGPDTEPATRPATATAPALPEVRWHAQYKPAARQAQKEKTLLLVVYMDAGAPACEAFEARTLGRVLTRRFLASFAAVKLDIASTEGRGRFAKTGAAATPLTQVLTPKGELLDSIPGCIIPASKFRRRLEHALEYWKAIGTRPFDAEAQWKAVQARLKLSTRHKTVPVIDRLLKLSVRKLPVGATPARLHLARGKALLFTKAGESQKALKRALKLGADDAQAAGEAMLSLARLAERAEKYKQAHEYCLRYIKTFPEGPGIGRAWYTRAVLEVQALDDMAAARQTLREFIRLCPDSPRVVDARRLLKMLAPPAKKPVKKPATKPATKPKVVQW